LFWRDRIDGDFVGRHGHFWSSSDKAFRPGVVGGVERCLLLCGDGMVPSGSMPGAGAAIFPCPIASPDKSGTYKNHRAL